MGKLNLKVTIYSRHTSGYSSFRGNIGKKAPNILKQEFKETEPLKVLHTDVTQVRLQKGKWGYIRCLGPSQRRNIILFSKFKSKRVND